MKKFAIKISALLLGTILLAGCIAFVEYDPPDPNYVAVEAINGVPTGGVKNFALVLKATVSPKKATSQDIVWTIKNDGGTNSTLDRNILSPKASGIITLTATIKHGGATRAENFVKDFEIEIFDEFYAVTGIVNVPTECEERTHLTLNGTVRPSNATNKTITWEVKDAGTTEAEIEGNVLMTTAPGKVVVTATIQGGKMPSIDYVQDFIITIIPEYIAVREIVNVPQTMLIGTYPITGTVRPSGAIQQDIVWTVLDPDTTNATIDDGKLTTTATGTVTVRATVIDGLRPGGNYTHDFEIEIVATAVPVTNITSVPDKSAVGESLRLTGIVNPPEATFRIIEWSVKDGGTTGATITDDMLTATSTGTVTVTATITNGLGVGSDYTEDFDITIAAAFVAVSSITGIPSIWNVNVPLTLNGIVAPNNATHQNISWEIEWDRETGSVLSGNTLTASADGYLTVRATIANGKGSAGDYIQDFDIDMVVPVTNITGVPASGYANTSLPLGGTVEPSNATHHTIVWTVKDQGGTGASITGGVLTATNTGTVTVTAKIANGKGSDGDYEKDFTITIAVGFVAVTGIADVPTEARVGKPLTLTGTVQPGTASYQTIAWSVVNAGETGATITNGELTATSRGTVTVRATIINGTSTGNYTHDYTITVKGPVVYTVGLITVGTNTHNQYTIACYWEDQTQHILMQETPVAYDYSSATGIVAADDGKLYISGYHQPRYQQPSEGDPTACYWVVDGSSVTRHDLSKNAGDWTHATAITASGGKLYLAGDENGTSCYWVVDNSTETKHSLTDYFEPIGIAVHGTSVWVAEENGYWDPSGSYHNLGDSSSYVTGIAITDNGDVYLSGYYYPTADSQACYWKITGGSGTAVHTVLPLGAFSIATAVTTEGNNWYVVGEGENATTMEAALHYWENGTLKEVSHNLTNMWKNSFVITVLDGDICIAGLPANTEFFLYWAIIGTTTTEKTLNGDYNIYAGGTNGVNGIAVMVK